GIRLDVVEPFRTRHRNKAYTPGREYQFSRDMLKFLTSPTTSGQLRMRLNNTELRAVVTVAIIMASRLLGIFLILHVFSVYAEKYPRSSIAMAGVAFGIYALAQSV